MVFLSPNCNQVRVYKTSRLYRLFLYALNLLQSNLAISNSVNSKSPLFRRKIECPWIYPFPLRFPGYFEDPLFRTFFHFPWHFEIAGFDCILKPLAQSDKSACGRGKFKPDLTVMLSML